MKSKLLKIIVSLVIIILLVVVFGFFILNILTNELKIGSAIDFIKQASIKSKEFSADDLGHQIGKKINEPVFSGEAMKVSPSDFQQNGQNYVNLGPGIFLFPGRYRLTYDLAVSEIDNGQDFAVMDVFQLSEGEAAEKTLNSSDYYDGSLKSESLEFQTDGGRSFEFRVLYLGKGELRVGKAKVELLNKDYKVFIKKILTLKWKA